MSDESRRQVRVRHDALGQAASADLVDRVWRRLDANLDSPRKPVLRPAPLFWGGLASAATFVLGVLVGQGGMSASPQATVALEAEPRVRAAGRSGVELSQLPALDDSDLAQRPAADPDAPPSRRRPSSDGNRGYASAPSPSEDPIEGVAEASPLDLLVVPEPVVTESIVTPPPSWQRLANAGEYEAALFELGQGGGFEAALLAANAEQLMLLADVARATGQTQRAVAAFRRVVSEFRNEPVAPLAAYSLGSLLQKAGDASGATNAFAVYRALSPEGDFAEDALVRQLRSAVERDDREYAEQLAAQYRTAFPEGRRGEEVDHWLAELGAREQARIQQDAGAEQGAPPPAAASDDPAGPGQAASDESATTD